MEEVSKTSAQAEIAPKAAEDANNANPQNADAKDTVPMERYKELEAFATRARQGEIANAVRAAKADPRALLEISDAKVQAAAVKEIYGLDTMAQVQEVFGKDFWKAKDNDGEGSDEITSIKTELKLLKVKGESERIENAIKALKASNPNLITSEKDEETLRSEMRLISTELSPEERVSKAARLAFGDVEGNKAKELVRMQSSAAGSGSASQDNNSDYDAKASRSWLTDMINPYKKK